MATLTTCLDYLALGKNRHAADVLAQRLGALELAHKSGSWEKAQYVELIEPLDSAIVDKEMELVAVEEAKLQNRLFSRGPNYSDNAWSLHAKAPTGPNYSDRGKGKGDPWKGGGRYRNEDDQYTQKGKKGKGKDPGKPGRGKGY